MGEEMTITQYDPEAEEGYIDGQRATSELFDHMEERAMKGAKRPRSWLAPGGKSLSGDGTHSPVLRLVVSKDTRDQVAKAAADAGMSVSRWLRRTVEEKLAA